ncbi:MAG: hypothetical protein ABSG43_12705 [Solirubrobacteraceae bacterium]
MIARATVSAPEMIGLLVWWTVVLAAPVVLVRRWRRRRRTAERLREQVGQPAAQQGAARPAQPPPPGGMSKTGISAESGVAIARIPPDALKPLCRFVDFQRRLELAAYELRVRLAQLPTARWRIEPYPLTGERRNTFVILGETGIFVVSATYAPGHWDDVIAVSRLASKIQVLLPGYGGPVQRAICHPFTSTEPRIWHRADERGDWVGAWLVGGDSVVEWLLHFGPQHGLSAVDLARFDELAKPNWLKGAIPTAPSWPQIHQAPSAGSHE